jgi:hypothetical protein
MTKPAVLIILLLLTLVDGFAGQYFYPGESFPPITPWFSFAYAFLGFCWYHVDTNERNYQRTIFLNIGIIGFGFIAFPYYFFRSRGLKKGALATFWLLILIASWAATFYLGASVALLAQ